jgi:hypothetical protein
VFENMPSEEYSRSLISNFNIMWISARKEGGVIEREGWNSNKAVMDQDRKEIVLSCLSAVFFTREVNICM